MRIKGPSESGAQNIRAGVCHVTTSTEVNIENSDIKIISISVTLLFEHIYCFTAWG